MRIVGADLILEYQTGTPYAAHILNLRAEPKNAPLFEGVKIVPLTFDLKDEQSPAITTVTGPKVAEPQTEQVACASVVAVAVSPVAIATSK